MATQINRAVKLSTPFPDDTLLFVSLQAVDRLSSPFRLDLQLESARGDLNPDEILGKDLCVKYESPDGPTRYFHGVVTGFSQLDYGGEGNHRYQALLRPWFWLLSCSADCRIFQNLSVPDIFEQVVKQHGYTDYKLKLSGTYKPREYCVQYRETDMSFLSRLLEQEGICYYFEHSQNGHVMVLADETSAHSTMASYEEVPFFPEASDTTRRLRDHLKSWSFSKTMHSVAYATTNYDFQNPRNSLAAISTVNCSHARSKNFEVFDYPATLAVYEREESERIAQLRIQELQCRYMTGRGTGNAVGLTTGYRFKLSQHPREDLNIEYLLVGSEYTLASNEYSSGEGQAGLEFTIGVEAVDAKASFRPARTTPKPLIHGSQTAVVVGPAGEEIFTDKYGRVKVKFHWDRDPRRDEQSSCWVRVSQIWAGKNWGWMSIPRIGQEVVVDFLEGDPDQPLITGRVYNQDQMPPFDLPGSKTQSGVRTRSSTGGTGDNCNEIRFEDAKGAELLTIHAEKNQNIEVEADESHSVGSNRTKSVGVDETTTIGSNRTENVGVNETIGIGANRTETVGANETINIGANRSITVAASETATVALQRTHTVGINETITVGAAQEVTIGALQMITVGASQQTRVGINQSVDVGGNRSADIGKNDTVSVGKSLVINAGDSITIRTGKASITMKQDGTIALVGKDITVNGDGTLNVRAKGVANIKARRINNN